ncbi:RNA-binding S4 domain-containing protein [Photobacterium sp. TLY01]|uniref:RNA-binding S4 domain-containing protein n=1 Tax=Photobacterium sp. TLY01 TaxID=2907534 RepID=UPI001F29F030|nr:RNA-binding S4 domain-containing protein [Photobacterium sp. TLY01]UIP28958.1 RNA-binding S4 domain-containing protein [Photobacterium sp. TLY01]
MSQDQEIEVEALGIEVSAQPIELYKVLKIANAVGGGGEAKMAISEGYVAVNGEIELRKRCKIYDGDVIEFNGEFYVVLCDQPVTETVSEPVAKPTASKPKKNQSAKHRSAKAGKSSPAGKGGNKKPNTGKSASIGKDADQQTGRKRLMF